MNEIQRSKIECHKNAPHRAKEWWDSYLPPNMTFAWALGTKSFTEITSNQVMEDGRIASTRQRYWAEANRDAKKQPKLDHTEYYNSPQVTLEPVKDPDSLYENQQLPETVYASAFAQALRLALNDHTLLVHLVRFDNECIVPENDNNAPFRDTGEGWEKKAKKPEHSVIVVNYPLRREEVEVRK